jgi:hypothetical protein
VLGALLGLPVLGGGGRLAMHALASDVQRSVTVQGTVTVLLSGLVAGVVGGLIYALLDRALPDRRALRAVLFAVVLVLLTLRGLNPVQPLPLALFLPIVLGYGALLERAWHARSATPRLAATST